VNIAIKWQGFSLHQTLILKAQYFVISKINTKWKDGERLSGQWFEIYPTYYLSI
jgi:hypothetical protein